MALTGDGLRIDGIGHFLGDHFLRVPVNQRSYAWEKDNVEDYWNDITSAMLDDPADEDYFIGSIVLSRTPTDALEVVDGQQRLATTTIILAAIRDYFLEQGNADRAKLIEDKYLTATDEDTLDPEPRFTLNVNDSVFFAEHIVNRAVKPHRENPLDAKPKKRFKDSHKCIATAGQTIRKFVFQHVAGARPGDAKDRLMRIVKYIREHVKVICVVVPDHEDAYTIFETLNDRGLDLSKADLLKNHLFRTSAKRQKDVESRWSAMTGSLESATKKDFTVDFIRYLWISMHGHVRGKDLYKQIKKQITEQNRAVELSNQLADNAIVYAAILNSDHPRWDTYGEPTRVDLSNLIMLGIERLHPITLAVAARFKSTEEVKKSIYYLVCASVRILIAGPAPGGQFEKSIADVAPQITSGAICTAAELAESMNKEIVPPDAEFEAAFAVATVSQSHLSKYYLRALNASYDKQERHPARVHKSKSNPEHILPLNRSADWGHFKEDSAKAYVKRIGNLTLLTPQENVESGNLDYVSVKLPIYRDTTFAISNEIAAKWPKEWTEETIESRQKELAKRASAVWTRKIK